MRPAVRSGSTFALTALLLAACQFVPPQLRGGELIVMEVANRSDAPAQLAVAAMGNLGDVVGSAEPSVVPPRRTVTVNFFVPHAGQWGIWANGGELMGEPDLRGRRGNVPMGIEIGADGQASWWCRADCP